MGRVLLRQLRHVWANQLQNISRRPRLLLLLYSRWLYALLELLVQRSFIVTELRWFDWLDVHLPKCVQILVTLRQNYVKLLKIEQNFCNAKRHLQVDRLRVWLCGRECFPAIFAGHQLLPRAANEEERAASQLYLILIKIPSHLSCLLDVNR